MGVHLGLLRTLAVWWWRPLLLPQPVGCFASWKLFHTFLSMWCIHDEKNEFRIHGKMRPLRWFRRAVSIQRIWPIESKWVWTSIHQNRNQLRKLNVNIRSNPIICLALLVQGLQPPLWQEPVGSLQVAPASSDDEAKKTCVPPKDGSRNI